jgi:hypothetical protein
VVLGIFTQHRDRVAIRIYGERYKAEIRVLDKVLLYGIEMTSKCRADTGACSEEEISYINIATEAVEHKRIA